MTDLIITEEQLGDLRGALAELREISGIKTKRVQELEAINAELVAMLSETRYWIVKSGVAHPSAIVNQIDAALKRAKGES